MDSLVLRDDVINDEDDSTMSSDLLSSMSNSTQFFDATDSEAHDGSSRPKRKSGSLSELTLPGSLPHKKQRPESLSCHQELGPDCLSLETPESASETPHSRLLASGDHLTDVHCDPAPTSPRSPGPGHPATGFLGGLMRPQGRSMIPDKENPPEDILQWVSTFSRWSHAERLLAIDQLIDSCEPQQVRHMMQVIEPQFQRDFISLLPKELALYVLSFLPPKDLLKSAQTCKV